MVLREQQPLVVQKRLDRIPGNVGRGLEQHQFSQDAFELVVVAGPVVLCKQLQRRRLEAHALGGVDGVQLADVQRGQVRNVLLVVAQRRQVQHGAVKPAHEKLFPRLLLGIVLAHGGGKGEDQLIVAGEVVVPQRQEQLVELGLGKRLDMFQLQSDARLQDRRIDSAGQVLPTLAFEQAAIDGTHRRVLVAAVAVQDACQLFLARAELPDDHQRRAVHGVVLVQPVKGGLGHAVEAVEVQIQRLVAVAVDDAELFQRRPGAVRGHRHGAELALDGLQRDAAGDELTALDAHGHALSLGICPARSFAHALLQPRRHVLRDVLVDAIPALVEGGQRVPGDDQERLTQRESAGQVALRMVEADGRQQRLPHALGA